MPRIIPAAQLPTLDTSDRPYGWTPSEAETKLALDAFVRNHPGWLAFAKSKDPVFDGVSDADAFEELKLYQGMQALAFHDKAHALYDEGQKEKAKDTPESRSKAAGLLLEARRISQGVRRATAGIEIHPGATIGENFFIDHGAGVVIGETAIIGNKVFLYHDVTLGATGGGKSTEKNDYGIIRRHPKLGDGVVCSKGTAILGPVTVGAGTKFASCALLDGNITVGSDSIIGTEALVRGTVSIGDKVRIGAGVQVVTRYQTDADGKLVNGADGKPIEIPITIGDNAIIDPGVLITQDVPQDAHVIGNTPYLPHMQTEGAGALVTIKAGKTDLLRINQKGEPSKPSSDLADQIIAYIGKGIDALTGKAKEAGMGA